MTRYHAMTRLAACYENGALFWRGSDPKWVEWDADFMARLHAEFVSGPYPNPEYARQIAAALAEYHAQLEEAA